MYEDCCFQGTCSGRFCDDCKHYAPPDDELTEQWIEEGRYMFREEWFTYLAEWL